MRAINKEQLLKYLADLKPVLDATGRNYVINCPVCGERECSISVKDPYLWGCFRLKNCGEKGNLWKLLKLQGKISEIFTGAKTGVQKDYIDIKTLSIFNDREEVKDDVVDSEELPTITPPFGWTRIESGDPYLDQRGFTAYNNCYVGRTNMDPGYKKNYIIFLVKENNETKGYVARHVWDKKEIEHYNKEYEKVYGIKNKIKRYKNSPGVDFSKLLYGYDELEDNCTKPVVLVEGIFDKHAIDQKLGLQDDPFMHVLATFKCFITPTQIFKLKLKGVNDVILFYDPDVINAIKNNINKLLPFFNVRVIIADNNKDPDEMSIEELLDTFEKNMYSPDYVKGNFVQVKALK